LRAGAIGAAIGMLAGTGVAWAVQRIAVVTGTVPDVAYSYADPVVLVPVAGVVLTTWPAAWVGTRAVTRVTPLQALGRAEEAAPLQMQARHGRNRLALVLFIAGTAILAL